MSSKFYVYEHWRPDLDVCFYVGKGHGNRAQDFKKSRNRHYRGILKKLTDLGMCIEVRMVASGLVEDAAYALEIDRIVFWKLAGIQLSNKTAGGDGLRSPSAEVRSRLAAAARLTHAGRQHSAEERANRTEAVREAMKDPKNRAKISAASTSQWADPEKRRRLMEGLTNQKPSEARSAAMRRRMAAKRSSKCGG
jgi:hypothetical protein